MTNVNMSWRAPEIPSMRNSERERGREQANQAAKRTKETERKMDYGIGIYNLRVPPATCPPTWLVNNVAPVINMLQQIQSLMVFSQGFPAWKRATVCCHNLFINSFICHRACTPANPKKGIESATFVDCGTLENNLRHQFAVEAEARQAGREVGAGN